MKRKIVILDDSRAERAALVDALDREFLILDTPDGQTPLQAFLAKPEAVSAAVLNICSPGADGFAPLLKLRARTEQERLPVVVVTSLTDDETRDRAIACGADGFLVRPFQKAALIDAVRIAAEQAEIAYMPTAISRDRLTGLLTRRTFFAEAGRMIARQPSGCYLLSCLNVESFKVINDQYGTDRGDAVLRHIADCISRFAAENGGLACRVMADRFAVLYPAALKSSELLDAVHREIMSPSCVARGIRIRIGRYKAAPTPLSVSAMFDRAVLAEESIRGMFDAFIADYDDAMLTSLLHEQRIVSNTADALKNGEFEVWFQPQYNHATKALLGAEALVRWRRDGALVPPGDFIPIFERNGFIYELDQFVWRQVCILLRRWLDEGRSPLPISVNISRYDIYQKDFLSVIRGLVKEYALPVGLLRLEVTESAFAESTKKITRIVNDLIDFGFTVEIDDFGSGYSSLNTLKDVPASILKLDMKFFENTKNAQRSGNIIESVVRMAKWLGMAVIAEGVEDRSQADYLKSIGCFYIQGYFYAKPMPLAEYETLMKESAGEPKLTRLKTLSTLDNSAFWDPKSMDTLIFNSYVGGACIFEYQDGTLELLRANERYALEIGPFMPRDQKLSADTPVKYLDEANRKTLFDCIQTVILTHREGTCEVVMSDPKSTPPRREYVSLTLRLIAVAAERYLFYVVIVNTTRQRVAEQERIESEKRASESAERLKIIMKNINGGVSAILIDEKTRTSRLVFHNDRYYELYGYTKEQAEAEKVDPLRLILPEDMDGVLEKIARMKRDRKPAMIDYRCKRRDGRIVFLRANASPMRIEGCGDDVIISVVTDITEQRLMADQLKAVVDNISGGVSATVIRDGKPEFVIVNDQFFQILGYATREEYLAENPDKYARIHPDDRARVVRRFETSDGGKRRYTMEYRVIRRDGAVRVIQNNISTVNIFGIDGPVQLSVASDVTDARKDSAEQGECGEEQQKELLDNLPCGAALFRYDGKTVTTLHVNRRYRELVNRNENGLVAVSALDAIHPDDRAAVAQELYAAIEQKRDAVVDIRVRYGTDEYHPFHVVAHIVPHAEGVYTLYATYSVLSEHALSFRELLPFIFSTIMESSADLAFAKDKSLRYLCCSRSFANLLGLNSPDEVIGKTDYELFPDELAARFHADDLRVMAEKRPIIDRMEAIPGANGTVHHTRTSKYLMKNNLGEGIGLYCIGRDITDSREKYLQLMLLTESIPGGLATFSCSSGGVRLDYCNDGFLRIFGCSREEYTAASAGNPMVYVMEEDKPILRAHYRALMEKGTPIDCIYRILVKGGGYRWVSHRATIADRYQGTLTVNAVLLDITERQNAIEAVTG